LSARELLFEANSESDFSSLTWTLSIDGYQLGTGDTVATNSSLSTGFHEIIATFGSFSQTVLFLEIASISLVSPFDGEVVSIGAEVAFHAEYESQSEVLVTWGSSIIDGVLGTGELFARYWLLE
jgi:hypothetical protein